MEQCTTASASVRKGVVNVCSCVGVRVWVCVRVSVCVCVNSENCRECMNGKEQRDGTVSVCAHS